MHRQILKDATDTQLRDFVGEALSMIKETNKDLYKSLENYLYKEIYGEHFNSWLLENATKMLTNEDGTQGAKWDVATTNSVAKSNGITFDKFNEYDFNYVMNMMYSDYFGAVSDEVASYLKLTKKFLMDKDAPSGKAYRYYIAMSCE